MFMSTFMMQIIMAMPMLMSEWFMSMRMRMCLSKEEPQPQKKERKSYPERYPWHRLKHDSGEHNPK